MDAGVDDEPRGAEDLRLQVAEAARRILVQADLGAEGFGIQRPTFAVGHEPERTAKLGQLAEFDRPRDLQVVAGHGFVGGQRFHRPARGGFPGGGVGVEPTRARTVERRRIVIGRRGGTLKGRDRPHAVGGTRQFGEELRQFGIDALADVAVAGQQFVGALVEELRIGVEPVGERGEITLPSHLAHHRPDLHLQPGHFAQADRVDLRRCQVGGGVRAHLLAIDRRATGVVAQRPIGRCRGEIRPGDEGAQLTLRRQHLLGDRLVGQAAQALLLGRRHVGPELGEGFEERAGFTSRGDLLVERRQHPLQHRTRRHPAERLTFAQPHQLLVDAVRIGVHARQHIVGLLGGGGRAGLQQPREVALKTAECPERHASVTDQRFFAQRFVGLVDEQVERGLLGRREPVAADRFRLGEFAAGFGISGRLGLGRGIGQPIVVAVVALAGGVFG